MVDPLCLLINEVRKDLAEATPEYLSDDTILQQLERAYKFLEPWEVADEDLMIHCTVTLASYFSYIAYTSLAEHELGQVPRTSELRIRELKRIAYLMVSRIAPVDENLNISKNYYSSQVIAANLTSSALPETYDP